MEAEGSIPRKIDDSLASISVKGGINNKTSSAEPVMRGII